MFFINCAGNGQAESANITLILPGIPIALFGVQKCGYLCDNRVLIVIFSVS